MTERLYSRLAKAFHDTRLIASEGWRVLRQNPQIALYPYLAVLVVLVTFPVANVLVYGLWNKFGHSIIFSTVDNTPHNLHIFLGLVTFSVFYTAFITSYFTCAVAADVLARLEGEKVHRLNGLKIALHNFFKITKFGLLAIFFFPLGLIAQRKKHVSGWVWVVSSSFTLHMPQMAPVIVSEKKSVMSSIRYSIDVLNKVWAEGIVIRAGMIFMFIILGFLGFLPAIAQRWWFDSNSAHFVGWVLSLLIWTLGYITIKVIGTVLTTTLYYKAKNSLGQNR